MMLLRRGEVGSRPSSGLLFFVILWVFAAFVAGDSAASSTVDLPVDAADLAVRQAASSPTCSVSPKQPAPSGYICGVQGTVSKPLIIQPVTTAATQAKCRDLCVINQPNCLSFSYVQRNKTCTTYRKTLANSGFTQSKSGVAFWSTGCFNKVCGLCPSGTINCSGSCINPQSSNANCGKCGTVCGSGQTCTKGACACSSGKLNDNNNCGTCGNACGSSQSCSNGICKCPSGTLNDNNNCGTCGNACTSGQTCNNGMCGCSSGNLNDKNNCGTCGNVCDSNQTCSNGACACSSGNLDDNNNCGTCGNVCGSNQTCSNGSCSCSSGDLNDNNNCGTCGNICGSGQTCNNGQCVCPNGVAACSDGTCPDFKVSPSHCGTCNNACQSGSTCANGMCKCSLFNLQVSSGTPAGSYLEDVPFFSSGDSYYQFGSKPYGGSQYTLFSLSPDGRVYDYTAKKFITISTDTNAYYIQATSPSASGRSLANCTRDSNTDVVQCSRPAPGGNKDFLNCDDNHLWYSGSSTDSGCAQLMLKAAEPPSCPFNAQCSGSNCQCPTGSGQCGGTTSGPCYRFSTDQFNCGRCGNKCSPGETCSGGNCACSNTSCPSGASCTNGRCICSVSGQAPCSDGTCPDLSSSSQHCGTCDNTCPSASDGFCYKGACRCNNYKLRTSTGRVLNNYIYQPDRDAGILRFRLDSGSAGFLFKIDSQGRVRNSFDGGYLAVNMSVTGAAGTPFVLDKQLQDVTAKGPLNFLNCSRNLDTNVFSCTLNTTPAPTKNNFLSCGNELDDSPYLHYSGANGDGSCTVLTMTTQELGTCADFPFGT